MAGTSWLRLQATQGGEALLIGLESYIRHDAPPSPGYRELDGGHHLEGGAWYLVPHANGHYDLHQVTGSLAGIAGRMVATRTIVASPFPGDRTIYLGGYDANIAAAHNTAWNVRAPVTSVLGETR